MQQSASVMVLEGAPSNGSAQGSQHKYLSFRLGREEYGLPILKVQELRGYEVVTRIANSPDFIKGVINLRGIIVPIIDLRIKFRLDAPAYDQFTVVIILLLGERVVGMVVDSVSDVISLPPREIRPAPGMGSAVDTAYLIGVATQGERMVQLVDIDKLMADADIGLMEASV